MPSSRGSSQPKDQTQVSHIAGGFFTVWASSKVQEYWSGWRIPSPGELTDPKIKPSALQEDTLPAELPGNPQSLYDPPAIIDIKVHYNLNLLVFVVYQFPRMYKLTNVNKFANIIKIVLIMDLSLVFGCCV